MVDIARLTITRYLSDDGSDDLVRVDSDNCAGGRIPVVEALGLLSLAEYDITHHVDDPTD